MTTMRWFLVGIIVAGVAGTAFIARVRSRNKRLDVGSVSDQWVAQHRADHHQL
jgi:hypothetical protein